MAFFGSQITVLQMHIAYIKMLNTQHWYFILKRPDSKSKGINCFFKNGINAQVKNFFLKIATSCVFIKHEFISMLLDVTFCQVTLHKIQQFPP